MVPDVPVFPCSHRANSQASPRISSTSGKSKVSHVPTEPHSVLDIKFDSELAIADFVVTSNIHRCCSAAEQQWVTPGHVQECQVLKSLFVNGAVRLTLNCLG